MTVNSEKYAVKALLQAVLTSIVPSATNSVYQGVLPDPAPTMPAIVFVRTHYTTTEIEAGGGPERGNDDGDPNLYIYDYYDQLTSQTGNTIDQTLDAHDDFLEALTACFDVRVNRSLGASGTSFATAAGETVTSDANERGPYELRNGTATILATGTISVKQLHRYSVS